MVSYIYTYYFVLSRNLIIKEKQRGISDIRIIQEDPEPVIFNNLWIQVCFDIDIEIILFGLETV